MTLRAALVLSLLLGACTTPAKKTEPQAMGPLKSQGTLVQIEKTIRTLKHQIEQLQSLEEEVYSKSVNGDPGLKVELRKHENQYGNLESLEAALRVLSELREELEKSG